MSGCHREIYQKLSEVGRALGNGHRLELLEQLAQRQASVQTLANAIGLPLANASQHLQHLRRAGLVTSERQGRQILYGLTDERIVTLMGVMREVAETNLAEMERLVGKLFADNDVEGALEPMSREALRDALQRGDVMLIDVRPQEEFEAGHLPQAVNAPIDDLEQVLDNLPQNREIVAYCRGPYCALSHEAVQMLRRRGYRVRRYEEGFPEWKAAGLPVEQQAGASGSA